MILSCPPNYINIEMVNTAVCSESEKMREEYTSMIKHYFLPISTQHANPETRFLTLKTQWEADTAILSSVTEIALHPAYQQIIGMGHTAIRLILLEMRKKPGHWFWALKSITGEDPVLPEQRGRMKEMTQAWLRWGREKNYL
ncbi:MAG: hypothetical protein NUV74_14135 [Candidatus Brocadiaceae bacterium]|nr:hypothetical protein [Candidatus Brocadiaceae bacterium]